jgi:hypothetical protein
MASEAERYLRGLAVDRLRQLMPDARIVHELNVETGQCRVDLAAVAPDQLVFVEVKSRKDKLDRLPEQTRVFSPACHRLVVLYSEERWDVGAVYRASDYRAEVWSDAHPPARWTLGHPTFRPPDTAAMLNLLWREELWHEAARAGYQPHKRESRSPLMHRLWNGLTGAEVVAAVCRQLRGRHFAVADPPVES